MQQEKYQVSNMEITEFATYLIKNIVKNPDLVKISAFTQDEDETILEILVSDEDIPSLWKDLCLYLMPHSRKSTVASTLFDVFCVHIISVYSGINSTYCNNHP